MSHKAVSRWLILRFSGGWICSEVAMGRFLREIYCTTLISTNSIKKYVTFAQREQNYCVSPRCFSSLLASLRAVWINKLSVSNYILCLCGIFLSCLPSTQTTSGAVCFFFYCSSIKRSLRAICPKPPHDNVQTPNTVNQTCRRRNAAWHMTSDTPWGLSAAH